MVDEDILIYKPDVCFTFWYLEFYLAKITPGRQDVTSILTHILQLLPVEYIACEWVLRGPQVMAL